MPKVLSEAQVQKYRRDGYVFPMRAFSAEEAALAEKRLKAIEAREGGAMSHRTNMKPHLLVPWLNDLIRHPRILDAVEDVIGPNILAWSSGFFTKGSHDPRFVSWHQDSTYWGLSEPDVVTAWVAFTPSTVESGCMRVIPGTHGDQVDHSDTYAETNMLSRGQEVMVEVDESRAVDIVLQPGEFSLHHVRLIHGSPPNRADHRRIGYAVRYIPTHVKQLSPVRDSATLVRGVDAHDNFDKDRVPKAEFDADAVAYHLSVVERQTRILYEGVKKMRNLDAPAAQRPM
jgi:ectoine hydroxylase-related dioxygenase (phytanoyl-CoA dioxygenase family)